MPQRNIKQEHKLCRGAREGLSETVLFALTPEYQERVNHAALGRGNSRCKGPAAGTRVLCPEPKKRPPVWRCEVRGGDKVLSWAGPAGQCCVKSQFEPRGRTWGVLLNIFSDSFLTKVASLIWILVIASGVVSALALVP